MPPSEANELSAPGAEPEHEPPTVAAHRPSAARREPGAVRVRRVMRPVPDGIDPGATLQEAEDKMDQHGVNWLPVTEDGRCVGILTLQDIRRAQRPRPAVRSA
jgi:CBS domain-containing protein